MCLRERPVDPLHNTAGEWKGAHLAEPGYASSSWGPGMVRSIGMAWGGALLAVTGGLMAFAAVQAYLAGSSSSPWILYIYIPLGLLLLVLGGIVIARALKLARAESKHPPRPPELHAGTSHP